MKSIDELVLRFCKDRWLCAQFGIYEEPLDGDIYKIREVIKRLFNVKCEYADECASNSIRCNKNYQDRCKLYVVYRESI